MPRRKFTSHGASSNPPALATSYTLPEVFTDGLPLPKLLVFDLDYTLWPFWVDTHVSPPLKAVDSGTQVRDRWGEKFGFYTDVGDVLHAAKTLGLQTATASRTHAPDLARQMLQLLEVPHAFPSAGGKAGRHAGGSSGAESGTKAIGCFDYLEMYPGSKITHMKRLSEKSGLPYEEMLFFDDESRNRDVEGLGVVMWLVRDGVTMEEVEKGVESWRRRNKKVSGELEEEEE